ncbi:Tgs1 protein [Desarmillaria tabescens]|uniref:Trimethylguanosine synthase n=1 Tax=Armillaria tabescens TaxID=1929756 RepID=A0AA39T7D6_ARMTA|nr:Tgs1 protein [Desarmillaria tabescens]KAK0469601.1 Tgs1 protein [Desarmillaria tabescens]
MGKTRKRSAPFTGLSRFLQTSFDQVPTEVNVLPTPACSGSSNDRDAEVETAEPPLKKFKPDRGPAIVTPRLSLQNDFDHHWVEKYDATGLVEHYTDLSQVPEHLKKYFSQRTRFFSLYSTPPGCLLDEEGWYSVTPELIADQIAERCRCDTILDAFCGVGGNAIAFAKTCQRVIALDTSPTRLALARHNAQIYGVADNIEFILSDYLSFAKSYLSLRERSAHRIIDVVFLSPPWGGPSYLAGTPSPIKPGGAFQDQPTEYPLYTLASIQPIHGVDLFRLTRQMTPNVAYYLPRNTDVEELGALLDDDVQAKEYIEVEEEWMGSKLKALTCYFGGLVEGQGELF